MQRPEIEQLLPIRDPYLWIDEVIEISPTRIHARKHLGADLDVFRGHYVDFPVFPGAAAMRMCVSSGWPVDRPDASGHGGDCARDRSNEQR